VDPLGLWELKALLDQKARLGIPVLPEHRVPRATLEQQERQVQTGSKARRVMQVTPDLQEQQDSLDLRALSVQQVAQVTKVHLELQALQVALAKLETLDRRVRMVHRVPKDQQVR